MIRHKSYTMPTKASCIEAASHNSSGGADPDDLWYDLRKYLWSHPSLISYLICKTVKRMRLSIMQWTKSSLKHLPHKPSERGIHSIIFHHGPTHSICWRGFFTKWLRHASYGQEQACQKEATRRMEMCLLGSQYALQKQLRRFSHSATTPKPRYGMRTYAKTCSNILSRSAWLPT